MAQGCEMAPGLLAKNEQEHCRTLHNRHVHMCAKCVCVIAILVALNFTYNSCVQLLRETISLDAICVIRIHTSPYKHTHSAIPKK